MTLNVAAELVGEKILPHLGHLLAHEFHHTWTAGRCPPSDEIRFYVEGFTDYMAYRILAESGITPWAAFDAVLVDKLLEFESLGNAYPASLAAAGGQAFFRDARAHDLVYAGGYVVAALVDVALRDADATYDLRHLMRELHAEDVWSAIAAPGIEDLFGRLREHVPARAADRIEALVRDTDPIDIAEVLGALGIPAQRSPEERHLVLSTAHWHPS